MNRVLKLAAASAYLKWEAYRQIMISVTDKISAGGDAVCRDLRRDGVRATPPARRRC